MIQVEIVKPDTSSERLTFDKSEVLIGRKPSNDIVLGGLDVSGNHACLQVSEGQLTVVDLGSTNGTFVAGERVQMSPIGERAEVRVAGYILRVQAGAEGAHVGAEGAHASAEGRRASAEGARAASPRPASEPAPHEPTILRREAATPRTSAPIEDRGGAGELADPEAPPLVHGGDLPPPLLIAGDLVGDLPPLVADAGYSADPEAPPLLGDARGAPPLATTTATTTTTTSSRAAASASITPSSPARPTSAAHERGPERQEARGADGPGREPRTRAPQRPPGPDLAALWADPEILRIVLREGDALEIDRRSGPRERRPLAAGVDLDAALAALAGLKDLSEGPCSRGLVDGAALWWARGADGRLVAALERAREAAPTLADLLRGGVLDDGLALRLMGALTRGRGLLFAPQAGADALPLALTLAAADRRPGALVRAHVAPLALPAGAPITLLDADQGRHARAASIALALRLGAAWIAVDDDPPIEAAREAQRRGVGLVVIVDAPADEALRRAHARVAGGAGDLDYAHLVLVAQGAEGPTIDQVVDPGSEGYPPTIL
ncbi:MAG: FHA domain-containing protein [Nannocystaceae bacterium]